MKDLEKRIEDMKVLVEKVMRANEKGERLCFNLSDFQMYIIDENNGCERLINKTGVELDLYFDDYWYDKYEETLTKYNKKLDKMLEVE